MQQDTNIITQSVIDYFKIYKFCMNKVSKFAMKCSYLILRKIVKTVAHRGQILRRKCTKFDFGWGSAQPPDPMHWRRLPRSPRSPRWILGALLLREVGRGREGTP